MALKDDYKKNIRASLKHDLNLGSVMAVPSLKKIVINMGVGRNRANKKFIEEAINDMKMISGQKPDLRKAKKSISNFKLRKGQLAGICVTLRGERMWDFFEKLVKVALPRVKDFRGVSVSSFDASGNYSIGFEDHMVFPEIDPNSITYTKPLQITISTNAEDSKTAYKLLESLGMPFRSKNG